MIWLGYPSVVIRGSGEEFCCKRETFDADNFMADSVNDSRKVKRVGVVVEGRVFLVWVDGGKEKVSLGQNISV